MTITLATLAQALEQEIFDHVAQHLLLQGKISEIYPSMNSDGVSAYRNGKGLKCAVGCLIGDEEYDPKFETLLWTQLLKNGLVPDKHIDLISHLQNVHDSYHPSDWRIRLKNVADFFNLSSKILNDTK